MDIFSKWREKNNQERPIFLPQNAPPKVLHVSDYLSTRDIAFFPPRSSQHQILANLIVLLDLPDPAAALKAILTREKAGSTVIAPGLALPHARIPDIPRLVAAIGICPAGVADIAVDSGPIRLIVLFVGPSAQMKEHLAFLASVSALFQTDGLVNSLAGQTTPETVLDTIRAIENAMAHNENP